jgi:hypothetical protein
LAVSTSRISISVATPSAVLDSPAKDGRRSRRSMPSAASAFTVCPARALVPSAGYGPAVSRAGTTQTEPSAAVPLTVCARAEAHQPAAPRPAAPSIRSARRREASVRRSAARPSSWSSCIGKLHRVRA